MATAALFGPFVAIWAFLKGVGDRKDDRTKAALAALSAALTETRLYLRDWKHGAKGNRSKEAQIVRLWEAAAVELRDVDAQLSSICHHKAEYWIHPEEWSEEEVQAKGIGIDELFRTYRRILKDSSAKLQIPPR